MQWTSDSSFFHLLVNVHTYRIIIARGEQKCFLLHVYLKAKANGLVIPGGKYPELWEIKPVFGNCVSLSASLIDYFSTLTELISWPWDSKLIKFFATSKSRNKQKNRFFICATIGVSNEHGITLKLPLGSNVAVHDSPIKYSSHVPVRTSWMVTKSQPKDLSLSFLWLNSDLGRIAET